MLLSQMFLYLAYINHPQHQFQHGYNVPPVQTYQPDPSAGYFNPQRHFPIYPQSEQLPTQQSPYQAPHPSQQYQPQVQQDYQQAPYAQQQQPQPQPQPQPQQQPQPQPQPQPQQDNQQPL